MDPSFLFSYMCIHGSHQVAIDQETRKRARHGGTCFNLSTWEVEAGKSLWVWGQPYLDREFQDSQLGLHSNNLPQTKGGKKERKNKIRKGPWEGESSFKEGQWRESQHTCDVEVERAMLRQEAQVGGMTEMGKEQRSDNPHKVHDSATSRPARATHSHACTHTPFKLHPISLCLSCWRVRAGSRKAPLQLQCNYEVRQKEVSQTCRSSGGGRRLWRGSLPGRMKRISQAWVSRW